MQTDEMTLLIFISMLRSSTDNTLSLTGKDSKYVFTYFNFHAHGACTRALLCYSGAPWEAKIQSFENWAEVKPTLPFGTLPALTEKMSDGQQVDLVESVAIERYLAKKYGLCGATVWQETLVDIFYNQAAFVHFKFLEKVVFALDQESSDKAFEHFMQYTLPPWISYCEKYLAQNGNKGCFIGDSISLVDIKTSTVLDTMVSLKAAEPLFGPEKTPGLFALKKRVDTHPAYATYRKTEDYLAIDNSTQMAASGKFEIDFARSHIYA